MLRQFMFLLFCGLSVASMPAQTLAAEPMDGKDYTVLKEPVKDAPAVVEFFSFYCPPCAAFAGRFFVSQAVEKILPSGEKVEKYHVSSMGAMGQELTEAWSVAKVLGVEDKVELPLFVATQVNRSIKTENSIRQVFIEAGVSGRDYDAAKNSMAVRALTAKQQEAAKAYGVTGTPSFFVNGKYLVNNGAIQPPSEQGYGKSFADVVSALLKRQE
ncbi:DsbA family protein [Salmonella enterica]|uniref:DsbA family protein n=1 Tax=Salmonella enterica TaxID=28901 RepID=UPI0026DB8FB7|nr:DsbA family protein [Salmonella enterica]MDO3872085.1 DsbA family protein [Salmonella enterica]MDO3886849.1 DsbA family protein [Salmonella enterica]MDO3900042.1 DsbA family protein [Salmonella enterica]MDO3976210.1 DsbA family protein [Salmonella enterica]